MDNKFTRLCSHLRGFRHASNGNIAMMFAVISIPMISAVGLAVDLSGAYRTRSLTQNVVDASALAAARAAQVNPSSPLASAQAAATAYFNASKPTNALSSTLATTGDSTNTTFTLTATSWVSTPFLSMLSRWFGSPAASGAPSGCSTKFSCVQVQVTATASLAAGGNGGSNVEVSLMLDVTGSMDGTKLDTLKSASSDLVDTIIWADQSKYTARMAIVPFAEGVNVGSAFYTAVTNTSQTISTGGWGSWGWGGGGDDNGGGWGWGGGSRTITTDPCVVDRTGLYAYSDAAPGSGSWIPTFYSQTGLTSCYPNSSIVPLTSNKTTLKTAISGLSANGGTAGALGTQWAWFMISPGWATIWGTASAPGAYADLTALNSNGAAKLKKIAVLMTDGDYNLLSGNGASTSTVNTAALAICSAMKTKGITIYTVGFQLSGTTPRTLLMTCASSTDKFYDATSNAALLAAFRDIALKISTLRLTN